MKFREKILSALCIALTPFIAFADTSIITHAKVVEAAPVVDTAAYNTGELIGGKLTLANAARTNISTGTITDVVIIDQDKETVDLDVIFFDTNPTGTTFTDSAAFDPADADLLNAVCIVSLTTHKDFNDNGMSIATGVNCPFDLGSSTTLYAAIVSRASVTYTAATDLLLRVGITQD